MGSKNETPRGCHTPHVIGVCCVGIKRGFACFSILRTKGDGTFRGGGGGGDLGGRGFYGGIWWVGGGGGVQRCEYVDISDRFLAAVWLTNRNSAGLFPHRGVHATAALPSLLVLFSLRLSSPCPRLIISRVPRLFRSSFLFLFPLSGCPSCLVLSTQETSTRIKSPILALTKKI